MSGSYFGSLLAAKFPYHRLKELREVTNNLQEGAEGPPGIPKKLQDEPSWAHMELEGCQYDYKGQP